MEQKSKRTRIIGIRLTPQEYAQIEGRYKATTSRKLSDYLRNVLLDGKVTILTRNQSFDDLMAEMMRFRTQLHGAGNNINQAVRRLHTIRDSKEITAWLPGYETQVTVFFKMVDEIKLRINQFADKW